MADAEVKTEHFYNSNPLHRDDEAAAKLVDKHRLWPTWANRRWRAEQSGWRGLRRVEPNLEDELTRDVLACFPNLDMVDMELQTQDGWIRHGDLVLCVEPIEIRERSERKRDYRANHRLRKLDKGQSELAGEVRRGGRSFAIDPDLTSIESERGPMPSGRGVTSRKLSRGGKVQVQGG